MAKYLVKLSNETNIIFNENDLISLIGERKFMNPRMYKCSETNKNNGNIYKSVKVISFDLINLKLLCRRFSVKDDNDGEEEAKKYLDTIEKYDSNNISKYIINIPIIQVINNLKFFVKHFRYYNKPLIYDIQDVPIDPYIFGVWLGDGNSHDCGITSVDKEIIDAYTNYSESLKLSIIKGVIKYTATNYNNHKGNILNKETVENIITDYNNLILRKDIALKYNCSIKSVSKYINIYKNGGLEAINIIYENNKQNIFYLKLKNIGVINNKHIPEIYIKNSIKNRLELLAGFIDTDGYLDNTSYEIIQSLKNSQIFDDIKTLAESLGFTVSRKECIKTCLYKGEKKQCPAIRGCISGDVHTIPVRLERKKIKKIKTQRYDLLKFNITKIEE